MKKAKIALTAIGVFAIVGGALAFKANKFGSTVFCADPAQNNVCSLAKASFTTRDNGQTPVLSSCVSAATTTTCPQINIYPER